MLGLQTMAVTFHYTYISPKGLIIIYPLLKHLNPTFSSCKTFINSEKLSISVGSKYKYNTFEESFLASDTSLTTPNSPSPNFP